MVKHVSHVRYFTDIPITDVLVETSSTWRPAHIIDIVDILESNRLIKEDLTHD